LQTKQEKEVYLFQDQYGGTRFDKNCYQLLSRYSAIMRRMRKCRALFTSFEGDKYLRNSQRVNCAR